MTIGDWRQFTLAVTTGGVPADLTGVQQLTFSLLQPHNLGGAVLHSWPLGAGVVVQTPASAGLATLTIQPGDLAWATQPLSLVYAWSLIDALGHPKQNLERGTFLLWTPP
jgi:hypothetical protein